MLTKEMIDEYLKENNTLNYDWNKSVGSDSSFDLFLTIGAVGYRVASYSLKTKRVILHCPEVHIPQCSTLNLFIGYVNNKYGRK